MTLYHGSIKEIGVGSILEKQEESYMDYEEVQSIENAFEYFRPKDKISRKVAVFAVEEPSDLVNVGAYTNYIYSVEGFDEYEKSDLSWYNKVSKEMGDFFEIEDLTNKAKRYIRNYWSGKSSSKPVWEYRSLDALVTQELEYTDLKELKIEKANKKKNKKKIF